MRRLLLASLFLCFVVPVVQTAIPKFEKISDHCYYFLSRGETANVAAVVSDDGVLLVNPPGGPDPAAALEALKKLTARPIRWIVNTDYRLARSGGVEHFNEQEVQVLGSRQIYQLAASTTKEPPAAGAGQQEKKDPRTEEAAILPRMEFGRQMRLFPGGVEVRIFALQYQAHTGGDVVIYVPNEKVLMVGDLYVAGRYPDIDITPGEGSALGWLDGMKQVIDAVPLLKAAIQPKTEPKPGEEEKSLEESVTVVSARGPLSNLQEMKDLLGTAQKLRGEISKAVSAGREIDSFLASHAADAFRDYENLDLFARQLFDALSRK